MTIKMLGHVLIRKVESRIGVLSWGGRKVPAVRKKFHRASPLYWARPTLARKESRGCWAQLAPREGSPRAGLQPLRWVPGCEQIQNSEGGGPASREGCEKP